MPSIPPTQQMTYAEQVCWQLWCSLVSLNASSLQGATLHPLRGMELRVFSRSRYTLTQIGFRDCIVSLSDLGVPDPPVVFDLITPDSIPEIRRILKEKWGLETDDSTPSKPPEGWHF